MQGQHQCSGQRASRQSSMLTEGAAGTETVRGEALLAFPDLVLSLGGDASRLLRSAGLSDEVLSRRNAVIRYGSFVRLLELASLELRCPDFGLRLAALQKGTRAMGPLGLIMRNCQTLGQALGHCARRFHTYSCASHIRFTRQQDRRELLVSWEDLSDSTSWRSQVVEHDLLLVYLSTVEITGGMARARRVQFRHSPISSPRAYRQAFGCDVFWGAEVDGMAFHLKDLTCPVRDPSQLMYSIASRYVSDHFARRQLSLRARVRILIRQRLNSAQCSNVRIAANLNMHPRTLHRRLRAEGHSFDQLLEEVRRQTAIHYLQQMDLPLAHIVEKLGYSSQSVLSRSCRRWFSATPQQMRQRLKQNWLRQSHEPSAAGM
jgi:AraC-like DNA-binding protein